MKSPLQPRLLFLATALSLASCQPVFADTPPRTLDSVIAGTQRNPAHKALDSVWHPKETFQFFDLKPNQKVIEIWPKQGWYTEILAPYLSEGGRLITAVEPANTPERTRRRSEFLNKLADDPDTFGEAAVVTFDPPNSDIRLVGGVDSVISILNVHTWLKENTFDGALAAFYRALKSGGTLGIIEGRAAPGTPLEISKRTGYVDENFIIERAKAAGFVLKAKSEINANPADTRDQPTGVPDLLSGTLTESAPDARTLSENSRVPDRTTLLFIKPVDAPIPVDVVRSIREGS